ncbi:MurR/RpiR family transcriptional regulator [Oceanobacillus senegalensis]|uniref:MurR/RpiR family transcriptional regulator n=1 Tax=Oceanobacillus senegalensis TaxID=1936063 RepID=UPI000A30BA99|nr:MurR/RpiR family transcriptional regulator [Oceanobacillus senegalensis]
MSNESILNHLISIKDDLPKKQQIVCNYIIENYQELSVLSITELAKRIGVGQTTVMRFMKSAGYDSYNDFKKQFHYFTINSTKPTWWHLEKSLTHAGEKDGTLNQTWNEVLTLLDQSMSQQLIDTFDKAVDLIINSSTVNLLGLRTSKAATYYFEYMLSEFYPNVRQLSYDSDFIYDRILHLDKDNVLIVIALSPYTTLTLDIAEYCYKQDIPIILITDHLSCSISNYATYIFPIKSSDVQYSIVPVITLIEALVIEIGQRTSKHSIKRLNKLNKLLTDKNITT